MQCCCRKITAHRPKNGQKLPKTLEETLEKRSRNAQETLEVSASASSQCTQPKMMVVWPTRNRLGRGASPSLGVPARHAKSEKAKGNPLGARRRGLHRAASLHGACSPPATEPGGKGAGGSMPLDQRHRAGNGRGDIRVRPKYPAADPLDETQPVVWTAGFYGGMPIDGVVLGRHRGYVSRVRNAGCWGDFHVGPLQTLQSTLTSWLTMHRK